MATGTLAFALAGRALHHGCRDVSAGAPGVGNRVAAAAPSPAAAPALMKPLRPSVDGCDGRFEFIFSIILPTGSASSSASDGLGGEDGSTLRHARWRIQSLPQKANNTAANRHPNDAR